MYNVHTVYTREKEKTHQFIDANISNNRIEYW